MNDPTSDLAGGGPPIRVRGVVDLLAAVPYILGFHPRDSLVVLGAAGVRLSVAAHADLRSDQHAIGGLAGHLAAVLADCVVDTAYLVGYGPAWLVTAWVDAVDAAAAECAIPVIEALRVEGGRYWSYRCPDPTCYPPGGTPYDLGASPVAATATLAGVPAPRDQAGVAARVAPVGGAARHAMHEATTRAEQRKRTQLRHADPARRARAWREEGHRRLADAVAAYASGQRLGDEPK